ncbi:MAG: TetR/AcrR family transcriptional regulator [Propionibacteriales bacterium]|nr:TetR/AcrR family transcriptional regulator [Propionibacteriales bacterium]
MAGIAKRAGVAVQTVYFVFHTKPLLLTATIDNAVMGEDEPQPPELTPWWQEATTTPDGARAIELFVSNVTVINARAASLDRVALAASTTDPEVVDVIAHHESLRTAGYRSFLDSLARRRLLRKGLNRAQATDVLLTLVGSDVFLNFTEDRGWSVKRYVAWTTSTLCSQLLPPR